MSRTPKRGDIVRLTLDPALGSEQQGARPVLVLSPEAFNRHGGALICPITQGGGFARTNLWAVPLMGSGTATQGVVLTNQARTVDWKARGARYIESAPSTLVDEVLARVIVLLE